MTTIPIIATSTNPSGTDFENKPNHFIINLEKPIKLEGEWGCGLSEIYMCPAVIPFRFSLFVVTSSISRNRKVILNTRPIKKLRFEFQGRADNQNWYVDETHSYYCIPCRTLNEGKNTLSRVDLINKFIENNLVIETKFVVPETKQDVYKSVIGLFTEFFGQKELEIANKSRGSVFHIFKDSIRFDALDTYLLRDYHIQKMLVILPELNHEPTKKVLKFLNMGNMKLENNNAIRLEFNFMHFKRTIVPLDVNLNIIKYANYGNKERQLLRRLVRRNPHSTECQRYKNIDYEPLIKNNIDSIEVKITNDQTEHVHLYKECQLVLLLKKYK